MNSRRILRAVPATALLIAVASSAPAASPPACAAGLEDLAPEHRRFLEDVDLLISGEERETFLCLRKDYQRDAFVVAFWKSRDPYPDTARNELERDWSERLLAVRQLFESVADPRAKYWLVEGPPEIRVPICPERSHTKIEAWFYGFSDMGEIYEAVATRRLRRGQRAVVFFAPFGTDRWRLWLPGDRVSAFGTVEARVFDRETPEREGLGAGCDADLYSAARTIVSLEIEATSEMAYTLDTAGTLERRDPPSDEWLSTFRSYSTDIDPDAPRLAAEADVSFPGSRGSRTVVRLIGAIGPTSAAMVDVLGHRAWAFEVIGEVLRRDEADGEPVLFESFRYRFEIPASDPDPDRLLPVVVERLLRPGPYLLVLRIDDLHGEAAWRREIPLDVPRLGPDAVATDGDLRPVFEAVDRSLAGGEPSIEIVEPAGDLLSGYLRFDTRTTGPVERVAFSLDGIEILTKARPPFSVDLDIGELPRSRLLRAVGYDAEGKAIATDTHLVNGSPHRFAVRIVAPIPGSRHEGSVRMRVEPTVPARRSLDRLELYRDEERVATLYQEPFAHPVLLAGGTTLTVLRAVAWLEDGSSVEDTVLINGAAAVDEMNVDVVELYTTVRDGDDRPILDLEAADFKVLEDGVEQTIERFQRIDDTPIRGTILLDTSASMDTRLPRVVDAAARFFRTVVREPDELSVVAFDDRPRTAVPFTGELSELGRGLVGLRAERGTALYDSLIYALHQLNGLGGHRVVLLLSDGEDEHSRFSFDQTLEYARRSRVTVYSIGIDLAKGGEVDPRRVLGRLARETGGRAYFLDDVAALPGIYEEIAYELRAKYLLAYQSSSTKSDEAFRAIEVEVRRRGAEARTLRGYYP